MICVLSWSALSSALVPEAAWRAGARALGSGEAGAAALQGEDATWWNPAGLSAEDPIAVHAELTQLGSGMAQQIAGVALPLYSGRLSAWGLRSADTFSPPSLAYGGGLAYGRELGDGVRAGLGLAYYSKDNVDPEFLLQPAVQATLGRFVFGATFNEPGVGKRAWQGSVAANWVAGSLRSTLSGGFMGQENDSRYGAGLELGWADCLFLRGGFEALNDIRPVQAAPGLSAGLGLKLGRCDLAYAWQSWGAIGPLHRLSLGWRFSGNVESLPEAAALPADAGLPAPPHDPDIEKTGDTPAPK